MLLLVDYEITLGCIHMMSTLGGGGGTPKADQISCKSVTVTRGEGVQKSESFADVISTCPLTVRFVVFLIAVAGYSKLVRTLRNLPREKS